MKRLILATALVSAFGLGGVAVAQTSTDASANTTAATGSQIAASKTDVAVGTKQVPAPGSRNCIRDTGTHIKRRDQACLPLNGNSYTREDLERTGDPNIGRALQQLDPSVQVTGH